MSLKDYFFALTECIKQEIRPEQLFTCYFSGECSDFVRFNQGKIRQAGNVVQNLLQLNLIDGAKNIQSVTTLTGNLVTDIKRLQQQIKSEQKKLLHSPDDPYLLYATEVHSNVTIKRSLLPSTFDITQQVLEVIKGLDFVGILAAGAIYRGFANSFGQQNWLENHTFNLDFSIYLHSDKAVKSSYAGFKWDLALFQAEIERVKQKLSILKQTAKTINPGKYRTYLTPTAFSDILGLLSWGGFSEKTLRSKQSPLLRLSNNSAHLNPAINISENTAEGISPSFQAEGCAKPPKIDLITNGKLANCLISPRSAKEYNIQTNGANSGETPESINVGPGLLEQNDILKELNTGLYVNNLWYLNYSDRPAGRMTGMTRFATFWVENGQITSPINVMRFDDSLYNILGSNLVGLTKERELLIDSSTYEHRSTDSACLPGVLINDFNLTL
ncbi:MAG: metallopeptidase TldD-related protein [bacterium]|nr:metallopeptidase TldD-related protein [bacterium]